MATTPEPATAEQPASVTPVSRRLLSRISIQSKLLAMLLATSVLSAAVVGFIGYQSGRTSLRDSVFDRLTEIRSAQARQLESAYADLRDSLVIYTRGTTAVQAVKAFTEGFAELNDATVTPAQWQSVVDYYNRTFSDRLDGDNAVAPISSVSTSCPARCPPSGCWRSSTGLNRQFDAAAENLGVEQVRTLHNGYLASCGLSVPRLDNVRRTVDFAIEMQRIVDRFNAETGHHLSLRAGIDTGTVTSGLVARTTLAYDMWGSAVDLAYQAQSGSPQPGVHVTRRVYDVVRDGLDFTSVGTVTVDGEEQEIWRLV